MHTFIKYLLFGFIILLFSIYLLYTSNYYRMTELDHLDDRIRFGRLQFHRKANITVGKIEIHNLQKIFTVNFDGEPVFVGQMEHFLILMQAKGTIQGNGNSYFDIQDNIQKICKIQRVLSIYPDESSLSIQLQGGFEDCKDANYKIFFKQTAQNKLDITVQSPQKYQRVYILFNHQITNQYYGFGEQFSYLNLGQNRPYSTFTRQKGVARGEQPLTFFANLFDGNGGSYFTSYAPASIWFSSKNIAYVLNSHHYMAWINNKALVWGNKFTFTYIKGNNYKHLVKQIAQINGYTPAIPKWVNSGAIIGIEGNVSSILDKYLSLKKQGSKIAGIWIQKWISKRQNLIYSCLWSNQQLSIQQSRKWDQLIEQLKNDNVQLLIYINPLIPDLSRDTKTIKNYYKIAEQLGYFVRLKNGQSFKTKLESTNYASLIDFKNEEAVKFFRYLIQHALNDTNAKGMMIDFSQAYPVQQVTSSIEQGIVLHNQYPNLYQQKINALIIQILGKDNDFYTFSKGGHLNSPKYIQSLWTGNHAMNFNFHTGLQSCLTAILSSGLVGYSNTHCDVGGSIYYNNHYPSITHRSQILLIRWMQLSAFTAVFRTHQGNLPKEALQVYSNQFFTRSFAFYSRVYQALSAYRIQQANISLQHKLPLVRPLFLELEGIFGTQYVQDQFFLGSQIFVAPFLTQDLSRKYFLPKGQWKHVWDGQIFKGCDCERVWKNKLPAIFIRSSSKFSNSVIEDISYLVKQYEDVIFKYLENTLQDL